MLQRDCTCARQQRQTMLGALALGLSEVSAANVPGMGRAFASFLRLGERLLRAATRQRQTGKHRRASSCVQVDRILFRCWKDRTPYCESTYLQGLERCQPLARKGALVKTRWKTSA